MAGLEAFVKRFECAADRFELSVQRLAEISARPSDNDCLVRSGEACKRLGISRTTLAKYAREYPDVVKGRLYSVSILEFWLANNERTVK